MLVRCLRRHVTATIVTDYGTRYVGTNECRTPQKTCPRDDQRMPSGVGYELCREVCSQTAHAEVNACLAAGAAAQGATLYLEGHDHVCPYCREVMQWYGVRRVVIGAPEEVPA